MVDRATGRAGQPASVPGDYALEHARRVADIVGPSSAAATALAELERRAATGQDVVVVRQRWSWFVVPRQQAETGHRHNDTGFFPDEAKRLLATA